MKPSRRHRGVRGDSIAVAAAVAADANAGRQTKD